MRIEQMAYTITWVMSYVVISLDYRKYRWSKYRFENDVYNSGRKKLSVISLLIVSLIWVMFNIYMTSNHISLGGDWDNYRAVFNGSWESPSVGLRYLMKAVRKLGGSIYTLSRFSTFICVLITLIAYRESKTATPRSLLLLFMTEYFYLTMALLKQTFTNAFATLFFVLQLKEPDKKRDVVSIVLIFFAYLFHPTGFILVPLFFALRMPKNKRTILIYGVALIVMAIIFEPMMIMIGKILLPIIPTLGLKIAQYFNNVNADTNSISLTFIKAVPETLIVLLGLYKRKYLVKRIKNYDNYLFIAMTGVFFYLMSIYSTWIYRMIYLFHFLLFVFFDAILENLTIKSNRNIIFFIVFTMLATLLYRFIYLSFTL